MNKLYEFDYHAWALQQAEKIRFQQWESIDIENLVEELESLARSERKELVNRLGKLLGHLLKWEYQPNHGSNSWVGTIREQRRHIKRLLQQNPSLKPFIPEAVQQGYEDGVDLAVQETNLPDSTFPKNCPYTSEQIGDTEFYPERDH
ncbi:MAG: DUF29 domain-containing protein [Cyanobacteria bacterium QS_3_48_167]|nr:MAG: DUF29 domain-containing protein [Cyanobacteria bacterium QS_3_48_167]